MIEIIVFGDHKLMALKSWKILQSNYLRPRYRFDKVELPNGKVFEATALEFRAWASVLALTKKQEVVLVKQYRHGAQEIVWEFPGGEFAERWRMVISLSTRETKDRGRLPEFRAGYALT